MAHPKATAAQSWHCVPQLQAAACAQQRGQHRLLVSREGDRTAQQTIMAEHSMGAGRPAKLRGPGTQALLCAVEEGCDTVFLLHGSLIYRGAVTCLLVLAQIC